MYNSLYVCFVHYLCKDVFAKNQQMFFQFSSEKNEKNNFLIISIL